MNEIMFAMAGLCIILYGVEQSRKTDVYVARNADTGEIETHVKTRVEYGLNELVKIALGSITFILAIKQWLQ